MVTEQVERISAMESRFRRALQVVSQLSAALDEYESAAADIAVLSDYYGSDTWRQDFADDEAGRLPEGLERGVLSEDGVWDLLGDLRLTVTRMLEIANKSLSS